MKKKKIAIFANGWNSENLSRYVQGLCQFAPDNSMDFCVFLCHATYGYPENMKKSMATIFDLPDLTDFDGAIIYTPGLNFPEMIDHIFEKVEAAGIPAISLGREYKDFYYVGIDNYSGMKQLVEHLLDEHGVKTCKYVAGSRENEDSNIRLKAIQDVFAERGYSFTEDDVFYTNWELFPAEEYIGRLCSSGEKMPDAILCANDFLAEVVSFKLEKYNYVTPDDILITGFDYIKEGHIFYPSIASVDQRYEYMGEKTISILLSIFGNKKIERINNVECKFCPGESCGCQNMNDEFNIRRRYVREIPIRSVELDRLEGRRVVLEKAIVASTCYEDLKKNIRKDFADTSGREGSTFYCMLDPAIEDIAEREDYPEYEFSNEMDVAVCKVAGENMNLCGIEERMPTRKLIPSYNWDGKNHLFVFIPIHYEAYVCGYMIFVDREGWIYDKLYSRFEVSFIDSLFMYKRNVQVSQLNAQLSEIMEKDPLTKVKNRIAFEKFVAVTEENFLKENLTKFAVVYFDINNLKTINDSLGHGAGDAYIKNCSKLICGCFKHSPVFRIGGDEFITVLIGADYESRFECMDKMRDDMKDLSEAESLTVRVSVAAGMADYDPNVDIDFKSVFKRADDLMYKNKVIMKKGNVR